VEKIVVVALAMLFVVLNVLDVTTTRQALSLGARELNPVVAFLMRYQLFIPFKAVVVTAVAAAILILETKTALWVGSLCCLLYAAVVAHNVRAIGKMAGRNSAGH